MPGYTLTLGHDSFLLNPLQFIVRLLRYNSTRLIAYRNFAVGGLVASALAIGPKVAGSIVAEDDGNFKGDKMSSTTYFGRRVEDSYEYEINTT
jgi:hypothetical protein